MSSPYSSIPDVSPKLTNWVVGTVAWSGSMPTAPVEPCSMFALEESRDIPGVFHGAGLQLLSTSSWIRQEGPQTLCASGAGSPGLCPVEVTGGSSSSVTKHPLVAHPGEVLRDTWEVPGCLCRSWAVFAQVLIRALIRADEHPCREKGPPGYSSLTRPETSTGRGQRQQCQLHSSPAPRSYKSCDSRHIYSNFLDFQVSPWSRHG